MTDNELIAEFMEVKKGPFGGLHYPQFIYMESYSGWRDEPSHYEYKSEYKPDKLKYSTSWDWLMPVVEKIENGSYKTFNFGINIGMHDWVTVYSRQGTGEFTEFSQFIGASTKLEATYKAVVHFIKWYNDQPK